MFIGQIGLNNYFSKMNPIHSSTNQSQMANRLRTPIAQKRMDIVEIGSQSQNHKGENSFYKSNGNQIRGFRNIHYTKLTPDEKLKTEILPSSEQTSYTENDAVMKQYLKQYRINGHFEGTEFVQDSDEPVKLILPSQVKDNDLESFHNQLKQNGLNEDIDWRGVEGDFWNIGVGFDNVERFEMKVDYITSRYAVLKDRIQNQYSGDKQTTELDKLEEVYTKAKEEMANTFANNIGGFYEDLGQTDAVTGMKASVLAVMDKKVANYEKHLTQAGDYAKLNGTENHWLAKDDAYMSARLRESVSMSNSKVEMQKINNQETYSANDLSFAGVYAKAISSQVNDAMSVWNVGQNDKALGEFLAKQSHDLQKKTDGASIGNKMKNLIHNTVKLFAEKFMDALDVGINKNQELVKQYPWMKNSFRTEYINRDSVYNAFYNALSNL